jgi:single-strand DNA-binding protein
MNNLNSILIEGSMLAEPDFSTTSHGTPVCNFSLSSNRFYRKGDDTVREISHFDLQAWGKLAESVKNLGHKGRGIRVTGRLKQERWNDKEGNQRSKTVIVSEHIEFRPEQQDAFSAEYSGETALAG